ncbi:MAG: homocysteine S-methyltransferase [Eubacterium sp.]
MLVIDGSMSTALENLGFPIKNGGLWTAEALISRPDLVKKVHLDYFRAGADMGISCSYQASMKGLREHGFTGKQAGALICRSMDLLKEARRAFWKEYTERPSEAQYESGIGEETALKAADSEGESGTREMSFSRPYPLALGSCGPYGAYLGDGSEYRGNYGITDKQLLAFHRERAEILLDAGADLLLFETVPSLREAEIEADLAESLHADYWISFSCRDGQNTCEGQPVSECAAVFSDRGRFPGLKMIGVNCTLPEYISSLIAEFLPAGLPVAVYPNSGMIYDPRMKIWNGDGSPEKFRQYALEWYRNGAAAVGGCCTTTPEHIRAVKSARDQLIHEKLG